MAWGMPEQLDRSGSNKLLAGSAVILATQSGFVKLTSISIPCSSGWQLICCAKALHRQSEASVAVIRRRRCSEMRVSLSGLCTIRYFVQSKGVASGRVRSRKGMPRLASTISGRQAMPVRGEPTLACIWQSSTTLCSEVSASSTVAVLHVGRWGPAVP